MTGPDPDFIIIGAMKCGTSTLAAQLACQDGVFLTTPKEPNFFSDDEIYARGHGWYRSLFAAAAPQLEAYPPLPEFACTPTTATASYSSGSTRPSLRCSVLRCPFRSPVRRGW